MSEPTPQPSPQVALALARNDKIAAIKQLREETGLGLKEAKDLVDAFADQPKVAASREALTAAWSQTMQDTDTEPSGLSPGQQPGSGATAWWIGAGVAAAALVAWFLLRR